MRNLSSFSSLFGCIYIFLLISLCSEYNASIFCHGIANGPKINNPKNNISKNVVITSSTQSSKRPKYLPEKELINRRKSPALWRNDLNNHHLSDPNNPQSSYSSSFQPTEPPEIMSPVGGWPQLHAAIANGADSIYLGLSSYSARARAANFDEENLYQAVETCHESHVKVYVALNTLVFNHELEEIENLVRICMDAKVDALIVQDLGVARMVQEMIEECKDTTNLELHASTQQTVTSADGVQFASKVGGATRVVLGRELSVKEIESVTSTIGSEIQVEAFVHGALCVSYSGQCFSSEAWGGRSANRGQCAQACRLPYGFIKDGELVDLQDMSYLLSPQDLCGLDQVPDLVRAGISCLKIEGRLKDAAYVAATTRAYRNAVDEAWKEYAEEQQQQIHNNRSHTLQPMPIKRTLKSDVEVSKAELSQLFARAQDENHDGLSSGFFEGSQHQSLVRGRSPRHRGIHLGRVHPMSSPKRGLMIVLDENRDETNSVHFELKDLLKLGDGIVIDRGMPQEEELGGPIYDIQILPPDFKSGKRVVCVHFGKNVEKQWRKLDQSYKSKSNNLVMAPTGAHVWKTSDANVDKKMKKLIDAALPIIKGLNDDRNSGVIIHVDGKLGQPLQIRITDLSNSIIGVGTTDDDNILQLSESKSLDERSITKAIGLLGGTEWALDKDKERPIDLSGLDDNLWCPISWVKEARRRAVEDLESKSKIEILADDLHSENSKNEKSSLKIIPQSEVKKRLFKQSKEENRIIMNKKSPTKMKMSVLARNFEQVETLCTMKENESITCFDEIIIDFLEIDGMQRAVNRIRNSSADIFVTIASPRIIKADEEGIWRTLLRLKPDGLLIRSAGLLYRMIEFGGAGASIDIGEDSDSDIVEIPELIGDFSLNAVNTLTARELLYFGLSRITTAYDLKADAITELASSLGKGKASQLEVIAHAHLPIFHTEHCVFARFLSKGNSYLDCGHVCTRHNVHLRDETGSDNLVLADMGCRNTVFAAQAQSGVHSVGEWKEVGIGRIRVELVDEGPQDVEMIIHGYNNVLNGEERASKVWDKLKIVRDSNGRMAGVSHGSLRNAVERRAGEI